MSASSQDISEVTIPANPSWKITNDVPPTALLDAAFRLILNGGDAREDDKQKHEYDKDTFPINLRSDYDIKSDAPPLLAPVARFKNFLVVDREEIEGYRNIQQLLSAFDSEKTNKPGRPLSIAVFGPPGSGKSFGIKAVVESILKKEGGGIQEFNLAQFTKPEQLESAFLKVLDLSVKGQTALAFFDEFDTPLAGEELGWLRHFLAPMQDGEFFHDGQRQKLGKSVFFFAGGTTSSFRAFSREEGIDEQDRHKFIQAKGPDFVSRLSAHINVLGVNRREDVPDESYILRRASVIRGTLLEKKLIGRSRRALVDEDFLHALLRIGRFKHGSRSLAKILEMCVGKDGRLQSPPIEQLMMHVDKEDADRLTRAYH